MDRYPITVRRLPVRPRLAPTPELTSVAPPAVSSWSRRLSRRVGRLGINVVFVAMMGCVAIMMVPSALGFHRYVIMTGSMTGTYNRGSIVFDRPTPTSGLRVGDPITYSPPPGFTSQGRVTHRIWSIHEGANGLRVFRTKGDANAHPDVWKFTLNQPMQDKVAFHIPEVGYLFLMLSIRDFRLVLVGIPTLIIALIMLRGVWREGGEAARRQKVAEAGWRELSESQAANTLPPLDGPAIEPAPARIDLDLRVARTQRPIPSPRRMVTQQSRIDLRAPLRVRRLASSPPMPGVSEAVSPRGQHGVTATARCPAAINLFVRSLSTSH